MAKSKKGNWKRIRGTSVGYALSLDNDPVTRKSGQKVNKKGSK